MKVEVWGPNIAFNDCTFHVHKEGCADTTRGIYRAHRSRSGAAGPEMDVMEADSMMEVVRDVYPPSDFEWDGTTDGDGNEAYIYDFHFFPCTGLTDDR